MPRRRALLLLHSRWSGSAARGLVLCVLTFGVVLPLCCHRSLYSYYFLRSVYLDWMSDESLRKSYEQGQQALRYWQGLATVRVPENPPAKGPELLVTVVTARRVDGHSSHYLLQVMQKLDRLLRACRDPPCAEVVVCDVESGPFENEDATLLEKWFRVVRRFQDEQQMIHEHVNIFEKEKRDYVYCLRKGWELLSPRNVVVLEDDALPSDDFFAVIRNLLSRRFALSALYVKLYHPERLQSYWNPEPYRILEWMGLGVVGATALLLILPLCGPLSPPISTPHLLFLVLYVMAVAELCGRHYLLELRRLSPQLYSVSPATECCTPAMLFPGNASVRVAALLDGAVCQKGNAKDMVLYRLARSTRGEHAHSVEPNLIQHIGAFSSVRANPWHPRLL
ncbi:transmembrane protein 246 [Electrophorus electricus]|uniref:Post-GPI attachment to proteins GalNAc transferase 4 n=1 Tax=Electrophorus electricus TaxID=8005 RepID=A0A4W4EPG1_ELEEL|nr:transmembrane protein 246 [Electrophorus electricus]